MDVVVEQVVVVVGPSVVVVGPDESHGAAAVVVVTGRSPLQGIDSRFLAIPKRPLF